MKYTFIFSAMLFLAFFSPEATQAQCSLKEKAGSKVRFQLEADGGNNGASIVFNPETNKYYSVIAGNANFPIEVFTASGESKFDADAGIDTRGLWYNPATKSLEGNAYDDGGWFKVNLDGSGKPDGIYPIFEGMMQPQENSVGTYDSKKKSVYFYNGDLTISVYKRSNGKASKKMIKLSGGPSSDDLNSTTVAYTGCKGKELALLDVNEGAVVFYSLKGKYVGSVKLDFDGYMSDRFNFAWANGMAFVFDTESRVWTGFVVCE